MTGVTGEPMAAPCNLLKNFLLKQNMQLVIMNSRNLMIFFCRNLADNGEIDVGRNFRTENL